MVRRPVRRTAQGDFEVQLPDTERRLLASLVPELRAALGAQDDDPSLRRLFPAAYPGDEEHDREYRAMVHDDLLAHRQAALDTMEATIDASRLDEEALLAWMGAVNDLRLVLGTRLDISEETDLLPDPDDPDAAALAVYGYLSNLLGSMVDALSE